MFDVSVQKLLMAYQNVFIFFQLNRNKPILVIHKRLLVFKVCLIAGLIKEFVAYTTFTAHRPN